jgi:hypothetical protein
VSDASTPSPDPSKKYWWVVGIVVPLLTALIGVMAHSGNEGQKPVTASTNQPSSGRAPTPTAENDEGAVEPLPDSEWVKLKPDIDDYDRARHVITIEVYNETEWTLREITFVTSNFGRGWSNPGKEVPLPLTSGSGKPRTVSVFSRQYDLEPYINFDLDWSRGIDGAKGIAPKQKPSP